MKENEQTFQEELTSIMGDMETIGSRLESDLKFQSELTSFDLQSMLLTMATSIYGLAVRLQEHVNE